MARQFVFGIGPVQATDGATSYFRVYPGEADKLVYVAPMAAAALARILHDYAAADLECEPALAEAAAAFGLPVGAIDDQRAHAIALAAFDVMDERLMGGVEREGLIFQFGRAAKRFLGSAPWRRTLAVRPMTIEVLGSMSARMTGVLFGAEVPGLGLFDDAGTLDAAVASMRAGDAGRAAALARLGVRLEDAPAFAVDAMRRAHGLDRVPIPLVVDRKRRRMPGDADIGTLAAAMIAVSLLEDGATVAHGTVRVEDVEFVVNARPTES